MENTLFYTLSTISQTLAGAIGLLAAFLLYHLVRVDQTLRKHLETLYSLCPLDSETVDLEFMWQHYDIPGLLAYFQEDKFDFLKTGHGLDQDLHLIPAQRAWASRQDILTVSKAALIWTAATILFALVMLVNARLLAPHIVGSTLVMLLAIGGVGWCFWLYSKLILTAARH